MGQGWIWDVGGAEGGHPRRGAEQAPGRLGAEPRGVRGRLGPAEQDFELQLETGMWEPEQRQWKQQSQGRGSGESLLRKEGRAFKSKDRQSQRSSEGTQRAQPEWHDGWVSGEAHTVMWP